MAFIGVQLYTTNLVHGKYGVSFLHLISKVSNVFTYAIVGDFEGPGERLLEAVGQVDDGDLLARVAFQDLEQIVGEPLHLENSCRKK